MAEEKLPQYVWMDGEMIPFDDAKIHVFTPTVKYGMNAFEGLRAYWNEEKRELYSFRVREHFQRLFESMKITNLSVPYSLSDCERVLLETLRANNFQQDVHMRPIVYIGGFGGNHSVGPTGMVIIASARGRKHDVERGMNCCISSWVKISDSSIPPRAKVGSNYQNSRLATIQANRDGYDEPLILDSNGKVSESGGSCFFMIRRGVVVTPPVTASILESITRTTLIELCRDELQFPVQEREIDRTEVYVAEEAFLCGSGSEVAPITSLDRIPLGEGVVGPMTRKIQNVYFDVVHGNNPKYAKWLTPTYGK